MNDKILEVIGENFNTSRRIKGTSPRLVKDGNRVGLTYTNLRGEDASLDVTDLYPDDPTQLKKTQIPHVAQAMRNRDMDYIAWLIMRQADAGATIIDLCIDEICVDTEERQEWMRWLVPVVQGITDLTLAIDSSDPNTLVAGLEVYDASKSRPAINSVSLEAGRHELIPLAIEHNALLFANASGQDGMPQDAAERVANLCQIMDKMDAAGVPMTDRYLDPLAFPVGAGSEFSKHYLEAVREIRQTYPDVHIFGGHSNTSFGLPKRQHINNAFIILAIQAGCDTLMIDPCMNRPDDYIAFMMASEVLMGIDEMSMRYMAMYR